MNVGSVIAGKYELLAPLGEGGMGSVWRARRKDWPVDVALKVIHRSLAGDAKAVARFRQEARTAGEVRGPHVVQILDDGVDAESKSPFIVMELLMGETLASRLERTTRLSAAETVHVVRQVASVLTLAHEKRVVHRDLKPENLFLCGPEEKPIVKVLDFGVAKWGVESLSVNALTVTGSVLGTPFYMSPEQLQDSSRVDFRTDLWSLGVMVFECLTGRRPFDSESLVGLAVQICHSPRPIPSSVAPVPVGFDEWFARLASLDLRQRFQSASELSESLTRLCGVAAGRVAIPALGSAVEAATLASPRAPTSPPVHAQSIGPLSSTRAAARGGERRRWPQALALSIVALGAATGLWLAFSASSSRPSAEVKVGALPEPSSAALAPLPAPNAAAVPAKTAGSDSAAASAPASTPASTPASAPVLRVVPAAAAAPEIAVRPSVALASPVETPIAAPAAAASASAPKVPSPAAVTNSPPKKNPAWDSSFESKERKSPGWDPAFDRN